LRADDVGGAALVFDHDLLAPRLGEALAERARHHVGHAAGGGGHRQRDGARGIGLRARRGGRGKAGEQTESGKPLVHVSRPRPPWP
jgi:hypothetical protein